MTFSAMSLGRGQWVTDPHIYPEAVIHDAWHGSGMRFATKTPFVLVQTEGLPGVDETTGHFQQSRVIKAWAFERRAAFNQLTDFVSGLRLVTMQCDYTSPSNAFHQSNMGRYLLVLTMNSVPGDLFPFTRQGAFYGVNFRLADLAGRETSIEGNRGRLLSVTRGLQSADFTAIFEFDGSFFPERNVHMKPQPAPPLHQPKVFTPNYIEIAPAPPVRRTRQRVRRKFEDPQTG